MKELTIDKEFKELIAPLSDDEYKQLKENILSDGCREPIVIWNDTIVDGHNRYKICTENSVPFQIAPMNFQDRSEVIMWMLKNQLGRRNLNDFQRNEIALKYERVIAEKMKERQIQRGKEQAKYLNEKAKSRPNEPLLGKSSKRKEMAKIAGTSEGSIQRSKLILEKGTPEQIERARQGGAGNNIFAIAKEIKGLKKQKHSDKQNKKLPEQDIVGDLYDTDKVIVRDMEAFIEEFEVNFDTYLDTLYSIIKHYKELFLTNDNKQRLAEILKESARRLEALKGDFLDERQ